MGATEDLFNAIPNIRFNPAAVTQRVLAMVQEKNEGVFDIVDPTNPFIMLNEAASTLAAAAMVNAETNLRKQYPSLAQDEEELYLHMSDRDYLNRFATPARATVSLFLSLDDISRYAVWSENQDYRKLVVPKNTQFTLADIPFTMQYPIEIRIKAHGGYEVIYDASDVSPIQALTSNIVDHAFSVLGGVTYLRMNLPVLQFQITSNTGAVNSASNFKKTFSFTNQYYYTRVYQTNGAGGWTELLTTHTQQVFDPFKPTAVLQVVDQKLTVSIPQVYLQNNTVSGELRVDVYSTLGAMDVDLSSLTPNAMAIAWNDYDQYTPKKYWSPLANVGQTLFCNGSVTGGNDKLSFDTLRNRVMTNSVGAIQLPITDVQMSAYMEDLGYDVVCQVDNVTDRKFLATRTLPAPTTGDAVSSAGLSMVTLTTSFTALAGYETVRDNGQRMTLLPDTLYDNSTGIVDIVPKYVVDSILALPYDDRVARINTLKYMYTPFHYVLDATNDRFNVRPYYLDAPEISGKSFVAENDTLGMSVSTYRYDIQRNANGYLITLQTSSDEAWKALDDSRVSCQIAFKPEGENTLAYLNGTLVGTLDGERVFQFQLDTNYDIDSASKIALTSFSMFSDGPRVHYCGLNETFYVIYAVSGVTGTNVVSSVIDLDLNDTNLPSGSLGLAEETLSVTLGSDLTGLWASSRSIPSAQDYARYQADVPAVYTQIVYQTDATGANVWTIVDGKVEFVVLHNIGDPILDQDGQPTYLHKAGDVMLDSDLQPIIVNNRGMARQFDVFTIDATYWFATDQNTLDYRNSIASLISEWVNVDIVKAAAMLLQESKIYFFPKVTLGYISALVMESHEVRIRAPQTFDITYYVSGTVYRNLELRASLEVAGRKALNDALQQAVVTSDGIIDAVKQAVGTDVIGVVVTGLGGGTPYDAITLLDDSARLSIAKRAIGYPDGTIGVEEAVNVTFIRHTE